MTSILTIDDSTSMRQMVAFILQQAGYDVVEAVDGVDGLAKASENKFTLSITDVNMPNMDGISLIKELRATSDYQFTPILLLTTESGKEIKQEARKAGATGWLVKPFAPDQLLSTIKKVIG